MTGKTDDELVQSLKETDELRFFDELVNRHAHKVRSMVYPIVLNNSDADDVTQEIFLRAYRGIGKFNGRSSFSTWLQRIAMNTTMTFLRKAAKHKHAMFDEHIDTENTSPTPSQSVISKEANIKIERALASLSPPLRAAITLTAIEGMSVKDAARTSGCLAATMYWRVHEARRILRTKLQEH